MAVSVLTSLLCGLAPALYAARSNRTLGLREAERVRAPTSGMPSCAPPGDRRSRPVDCVAYRYGADDADVGRPQKVNIGFDPAHVIYTELSFPEGRYDTAEQKRVFFGKVLDRLATVPE